MQQTEELRFLILAIQREGNRLFAGALKPLGLTPSQAEVVSVLAAREPLTLSGLGELLVCETSSSPSRLVDRLVTAGLVERREDADDRRYVTLRLTAAGRELVPGVQDAERQLHQALARLIAGQPIDETLRLLRAVAEAFPTGQAVARRARLTG